jgi:hypothetical protein
VRAGAATATIAGGQAQVKAMANNTLGTYLVGASATGAVETGIALTITEKRGLEVRTTAERPGGRSLVGSTLYVLVSGKIATEARRAVSGGPTARTVTRVYWSPA